MKTTLAQLYTKTTLCENREEGSVKACGHCHVCETGEHPNITYYRITEASLFKDVVSDLISISKAAPAVMKEELRSDNYRRFVIIDELQNCTRQSISPFLDSLEFASETTTVILISMDLTKLDIVVRDAIESRCIELSLDSLSSKAIADRLYDSHPNAEYEAFKLISKLAYGNMRRAWSILEYFLTQVPEKELTAELVYEQRYGGLSKDKQVKFFTTLNSSNWSKIKSLLKEFTSKVNEEIIAKTLLDELLSKDLNVKGIELVSAISIWLQSNYKPPLEAVFIMFYNFDLFSSESSPVLTAATEQEQKEEQEEEINIPVMRSRPKLPLEATPTALRQSSEEVLTQLGQIAGKKIKVSKAVPKCLLVNNWKDLLKAYDLYN